jgi:G2/mitotic-specific cyclin-B, other
MSKQTEINERMRAILIDWVIEVQHRLTLMPESLYLTVYIVDQYLSSENVPKKELQLVGVSAMLVASKYEEIWAPLVGPPLQMLFRQRVFLTKCPTVPLIHLFISQLDNKCNKQVKDLLCISDNAFSREQVLRTEKAILNQLQWNLTVPTMYMFLARYLKAAKGNKEVRTVTIHLQSIKLSHRYVNLQLRFILCRSWRTWRSSTLNSRWFSTRCSFTLRH